MSFRVPDVVLHPEVLPGLEYLMLFKRAKRGVAVDVLGFSPTVGELFECLKVLGRDVVLVNDDLNWLQPCRLGEGEMVLVVSELPHASNSAFWENMLFGVVSQEHLSMSFGPTAMRSTPRVVEKSTEEQHWLETLASEAGQVATSTVKAAVDTYCQAAKVELPEIDLHEPVLQSWLADVGPTVSYELVRVLRELDLLVQSVYHTRPMHGAAYGLANTPLLVVADVYKCGASYKDGYCYLSFFCDEVASYVAGILGGAPLMPVVGALALHAMYRGYAAPAVVKEVNRELFHATSYDRHRPGPGGLIGGLLVQAVVRPTAKCGGVGDTGPLSHVVAMAPRALRPYLSRAEHWGDALAMPLEAGLRLYLWRPPPGRAPGEVREMRLGFNDSLGYGFASGSVESDVDVVLKLPGDGVWYRVMIKGDVKLEASGTSYNCTGGLVAYLRDFSELRLTSRDRLGEAWFDCFIGREDLATQLAMSHKYRNDLLHLEMDGLYLAASVSVPAEEGKFSEAEHRKMSLVGYAQAYKAKACGRIRLDESTAVIGVECGISAKVLLNGLVEFGQAIAPVVCFSHGEGVLSLEGMAGYGGPAPFTLAYIDL